MKQIIDTPTAVLITLTVCMIAALFFGNWQFRRGYYMGGNVAVSKIVSCIEGPYTQNINKCDKLVRGEVKYYVDKGLVP